MICDVEIAVAVSPVGASGTVLDGGGGGEPVIHASMYAFKFKFFLIPLKPKDNDSGQKLFNDAPYSVWKTGLFWDTNGL